ncbi:MAG: hypothetical protein AAFW98_21000, partial [Pseudomonadota bacterium]
LTPQANTTVEPEMAILTPPGQAVVNARLISDKPTIPERLKDYFAGYGAALSQFANAPINAAGYACTGASYLAGAKAEDDLLATLSAKHGIPVVTAASAVIDALTVLGAHRIALLSPYDDALDEASATYWASRGLDVAARVSAYRETTAFHPIYSMSAGEAGAMLGEAGDVGADAIVMLGTGMPTLGPIATTPNVGGAPLLSCMFALAWRLFIAARGEAPSRDNLMAFHNDAAWRARLAAATPSAPSTP